MNLVLLETKGEFFYWEKIYSLKKINLLDLLDMVLNLALILIDLANIENNISRRC